MELLPGRLEVGAFGREPREVLAQGRIQGKDITYGDTHHPAITETNGETE